MNFDSFEGLLTHLTRVHKICRKFYESQTQVDVAPSANQVPEQVNLVDASDVSQFLPS